MWFSLLAASMAQAETAAIVDLCTSTCGSTHTQIEEALLAAGASSVVEVWDTQALSAHHMVLINTPHQDELWSTVVRDDIVAFARSGKPILIVGEQGEYFGKGNDRVAEILDLLGIDGRISLAGTKEGSSGCLEESTAINPAHPLAAGVNRIASNWHTSLVASDEDVMAWNVDGNPILASVDNIVVGGDSAFVIDTCDDDHSDDGLRQVFVNMWEETWKSTESLDTGRIDGLDTGVDILDTGVSPGTGDGPEPSGGGDTPETPATSTDSEGGAAAEDAGCGCSTANPGTLAMGGLVLVGVGLGLRRR